MTGLLNTPTQCLNATTRNEAYQKQQLTLFVLMSAVLMSAGSQAHHVWVSLRAGSNTWVPSSTT